MLLPHRPLIGYLVAAILITTCAEGFSQDVVLHVDAQQRLKSVSPWLTGACIEDVNHEIYGGIYSQMIFGESFQEPGDVSPLQGFSGYGGQWQLTTGGVLVGSPGDGPKLICDGPSIHRGEVSVEVRFADDREGNGGLLVATNHAKVGADNFAGYEISLDSRNDRLVVGRHDRNFELLAHQPVSVPTNQWCRLRVQLKEDHFVVFVNGERIAEVHDPNPLPTGNVGLRQWHKATEYRDLKIINGEKEQTVEFTRRDTSLEVSGMWDALSAPTAVGNFDLVSTDPFIGNQSQRVSFVQGSGYVGIANRGLNRRGMHFRKSKPYEARLWLRTAKATEIMVSLEDSERNACLAETTLTTGPSQEWQVHDFEITPDGETEQGRFVVRLTQPGQVEVGYAFLQPGSWGRYQELPVRRDVVEGLMDQGITVLRYGGSMVDNPPNYRWKNMIGPRDFRQPYDGHWYDFSTNGWGIIDFLNLCDATGFQGVPCFSIDESPQDMVDFLEYANGSENSSWGAKRVADGHASAYGIRYLQLGNEESVDQAYWERFEPIARALWNRDPNLILIVGDFQYDEPILDLYSISGAAGGIHSLKTHQQILQLARELGTEVWFDVHMWTDGPEPTNSMNAFFTFVDALEKLADGAAHRVVVFEFNANNHRHRRALSNAEMIGRIMRDGRVPMALSANCLQPDGQNDNGWDQGLLFLNQSKVWLQPPGYVTQMISEAYQPWLLKSNATATNGNDPPDTLDIVATGNEKTDTVVIQLVNRSAHSQTVSLHIDGMNPQNQAAEIVSLAASLDAGNTARNPGSVRPETTQVPLQHPECSANVELKPFSFTTISVK
ncbi:hypothetical protein FHS27_002914 [Rhodopirellula rubra]|uniref:non-reducing end alpha-L-arabinofuranosidase n=1 Tax=Aporhodopirellula rubra TaxID=980271 RepID=A0A7W5DZ39_9BACT|nr:family 16 glycoside hydrolase [Aporhodopirellula rubra]MBB3207095.1 hypothetical protein [Aporhodopirellula rubra]